jgi:hypothetical protein
VRTGRTVPIPDAYRQHRLAEIAIMAIKTGLISGRLAEGDRADD